MGHKDTLLCGNRTEVPRLLPAWSVEVGAFVKFRVLSYFRTFGFHGTRETLGAPGK